MKKHFTFKFEFKELKNYYQLDELKQSVQKPWIRIWQFYENKWYVNSLNINTKVEKGHKKLCKIKWFVYNSRYQQPERCWLHYRMCSVLYVWMLEVCSHLLTVNHLTDCLKFYYLLITYLLWGGGGVLIILVSTEIIIPI